MTKKKEQQGVDDRRKAPRISVLEVTAVRGEGSSPSKVELLDISLTGLRCRSTEQFPVNYVVRIQIDYSPISFVLRAMVVWCRDDPAPSPEGTPTYTHGMEFVNLSPEVRTMLEDHLLTLQDAAGANRDLSGA
ncbi:MAG: PilZ domain-containing protein [Armatimonadetes bacterium]|nr:PilZ domain-containing protein [Armatimonadota bacterium]